MKTQPSIRLSIPQSCHESWSDMTPADKGRFCLSCQKIVTDFTQLSDKEIIELLQSNQATSCGRFLPHQLNRTLSMPAPARHHKPFMSIAAIAAALTITIPFAKAANPPEKALYSINTEDTQTTAIFPQQDTMRFISGVVSDKEGRSLLGTTIKIKNQQIGTVTNAAGEFSLRIPDNFKKKVMVLDISLIGYARKTVKVALNKDSQPLKIQLEVEEIYLGGISVHFEADNQEQASFWTKFSATVRNVFS